MNLDGDMRKINYSIKRLKKVANSSARPEGIVRESGESSSNANVKHGAKQFQITPEELIRLKEILEQRDTEIAVLTQLLKKERRKPRKWLKTTKNNLFNYFFNLHKDKLLNIRQKNTQILLLILPRRALSPYLMMSLQTS